MKYITLLLLAVSLSFSQTIRPNSIKNYMIQDGQIDSSKVNAGFKHLLLYGGPDNAAYYGFSPDSSATANYTSLQNALNGGNKTIYITIPGTYKFDHFFRVYSNTTIKSSWDVIFSKIIGDSSWNTFINAGAETGIADSNIIYDGLNFKTNGLAVAANPGDSLYAVRGEIAFYHAKDVHVSNYKVLDLGGLHWGISFCDVNNFSLQTFDIEGDKDCVSVQGKTKNGIIRDGIVSGYDDRLTLASGGYTQSVPLQGDISNILYENIVEKPYGAGNTGFFARYLPSAWGSWYSGMMVRLGDTVEHLGNVYRVLGTTTEIASTVAPTGRARHFTTSDGVEWLYNQHDGAKSATIKNVIFRNCEVNTTTSSFYLNVLTDGSMRAVYPGVTCPSIDDNYYYNIKDTLLSQTTSLFNIQAPVKNMYIINPSTDRAIISMTPDSTTVGINSSIYIKNWVVPDIISSSFDIQVNNDLDSIYFNVNKSYQKNPIKVKFNDKIRYFGDVSIDDPLNIDSKTGDEINVNGDKRIFYDKWVTSNHPSNTILANFDTDVGTSFTGNFTGTSGKVYIDYGDETITAYQLTGSSQTIDHTYTSGQGVKRFLIYGNIDSLRIINITSSGNQFYFDIGQFKQLENLEQINIGNVYNMYGDLKYLKHKTGLTYIQATKTGWSGDISNLRDMAGLVRLYIDSTNVSGKIDSLYKMTGMLNILLNDNEILSGDISVVKNFSLSLNLCRIYNTGCNQYTASTLKDWHGAKIQIQNNGLSSSEVDQFLIDLAAVSTAGATSTLTVTVSGGTNGKRTTASDAAVTTLTTNGWTITAN